MYIEPTIGIIFSFFFGHRGILYKFKAYRCHLPLPAFKAFHMLSSRNHAHPAALWTYINLHHNSLPHLIPSKNFSKSYYTAETKLLVVDVISLQNPTIFAFSVCIKYYLLLVFYTFHLVFLCQISLLILLLLIVTYCRPLLYNTFCV